MQFSTLINFSVIASSGCTTSIKNMDCINDSYNYVYYIFIVIYYNYFGSPKTTSNIKELLHFCSEEGAKSVRRPLVVYQKSSDQKVTSRMSFAQQTFLRKKFRLKRTAATAATTGC